MHGIQSCAAGGIFQLGLIKWRLLDRLVERQLAIMKLANLLSSLVFSWTDELILRPTESTPTFYARTVPHQELLSLAAVIAHSNANSLAR